MAGGGAPRQAGRSDRPLRLELGNPSLSQLFDVGPHPAHGALEGLCVVLFEIELVSEAARHCGDELAAGREVDCLVELMEMSERHFFYRTRTTPSKKRCVDVCDS